MSYYRGNLEEDLASIKDLPEAKELDVLGKALGYGRCQQILRNNERVSIQLNRLERSLGSIRCQEVLQILWARFLHESDHPTIGALGPH